MKVMTLKAPAALDNFVMVERDQPGKPGPGRPGPECTWQHEPENAAPSAT